MTDKSNAAAVELACNSAFSSVKNSLDILGFILRSTDVRNAFEVYGPLLRLARQLLGGNTKLLLSSEWHFPPFTFIGYGHLPDFVLIGLPATESESPFLLPAAGHELGHSVWTANSCGFAYRQLVEDSILEEITNYWNDYETIFPDYKLAELNTNFFAQQTWKPAWTWAMRQAEEMFCDFLALRIFGEAYLYALAHILAPWREGKRSFHYPKKVARANGLMTAAKQYGFDVPSDYITLFKNLDGPTSEQKQTQFLLSLADVARESVQSKLIKEAEETAVKAGVTTRTTSGVDRCLDAFRLIVPAQNVDSLSSILNAAWRAYLDPDFFSHVELFRKEDDILKEVVLKSIDVFEIEKRLEATP